MDNSSNPAIPPTPFRFSNDELRALQECNSESFFYRSLPFSMVLGLGTHLSVKSGYIGTTKYGSAPKVALAIVAGYILGKLSYQSKCAEKIMALPDSRLGAMLRERRRGGRYQESLTMDEGDMGKIFGEVQQSDVYSDVLSRQSAPSHMDIDVDRHSDDFDTTPWRPDESNSRPGDELLPPPPSKTITSYDELRRKNREEYEANRNKYQRPGGRQEDVQPPPRLESREHPPPQRQTDDFIWNKTTNKYGDSWEK